MSDIRAIRQYLKPWRGKRGDMERYYVSDWVDIIRDDLQRYLASHPRCPSIGLISKVGKVWYDSAANPHVDGLYDDGLRMFIVRRMREEFGPDLYDPSEDGWEVDWPSLIESIPHEYFDDAYRADYDGEAWVVDESFLESERRSNRAFLGFDGIVRFESESYRLEELVLKLISEKVRGSDGSVSIEFLKLDPSLKDLTMSGLYWDSVPELRWHGQDPLEPNMGSLTVDWTFSLGRLSSEQDSAVGLDDSPPEPRCSDHQQSPGHQNDQEPMDNQQWHTNKAEDMERITRKAARETTHPISRWTKAEVMDVARSAGVPDDKIAILSRMKLGDIRENLLEYVGTEVTGNDYDSEQQRHTRFYRLRFDDIMKLDDS